MKQNILCKDATLMYETYACLPINQGCYCDREFDTGFTGYDCSLRIGPFGDDPLTIHQLNEIQQIACKAGIDSSNSTYGSFTLTFREVL